MSGARGKPLRFERVSKSFALQGGGCKRAVDSLELDIGAGEFVAIVGPSGCGKSTLLRLADGLIAPDTGRVSVDGSEPRPGPDIGFVFQNFRLIPWRTVSDNVGFALEASMRSTSERRRAALDALDHVGLADWADQYPSQLSGGMRQRVALARVLVGKPQILLMDEPFASLDAQTREFMQEDLVALCEQAKPTVLFVTHSIDEALLLADRVIVMAEGRVVNDIDVSLPRPRSTASVQTDPAYAGIRNALWREVKALALGRSAFDRATEAT
ncbi:NitT/TauT family transport system ATP-binding protein [Devosia lucknowensis]|uniref:NitT/TauT family transport system ATP-binding protein n=1 Tax=Devosia lucknowensis TaxID=1096929 RepID=A0A1Y6E5E4_9HYPH|nr:ABC transporter ATP-binding protein [Devosia lucknowensis]SMQ57978.1 NitT/TauT family transport system ATP-binding protein [Devosia lucknowensis]